MKLSELIKRLQDIENERGDVDVVCTAGYELPEDEALESKHITFVEQKVSDFPYDVEAPYLLIGGDGFDK